MKKRFVAALFALCVAAVLAGAAAMAEAEFEYTFPDNVSSQTNTIGGSCSVKVTSCDQGTNLKDFELLYTISYNSATAKPVNVYIDNVGVSLSVSPYYVDFKNQLKASCEIDVDQKVYIVRMSFENCDCALSKGSNIALGVRVCHNDWSSFDIKPDSAQLYMIYKSPASATISDVTVSGAKGTQITPASATITLTGESFKALAANTDVTGWFTNIPNGLNAKIKTSVVASSTVAEVSFSGTPSQASSAQIAVSIPSSALANGKTLAFTANEKTKWAITALRHNVSLSVRQSYGGSVSGGGEYDDGEKVTVEATPYEYCSFIEWTDGLHTVSRDAKYTFIISSDRRLEAVFDVPKPPESAPPSKILIKVQPANKYVSVGKRATFSVVADGDELSYQWFVDMLDGGGWQELDKETEKSYMTEPATAQNDGYRYCCRINDIHENELYSDIAMLYVYEEPQPTEAPVISEPPIISEPPMPPETGDESSPVMWLGVCIVCGAGIVMFARKKREI